jgi:hypothetical protein
VTAEQGTEKLNPRYDPPRDEVYVAFAEAMGAWAKVEWQMMFLLGAVADITDPSQLWKIFHDASSTAKQRDLIKEAAEKAGLPPPALQLVLDHLGPLAVAGRKRNRIVHAFWRERTVVERDEDDPTYERRYIETFREYAKPRSPFGSTVSTEEEELALRGEVRFYLEDLRAVRDLFAGLVPRTMEVVAEVVKAKRPNPAGR